MVKQQKVTTPRDLFLYFLTASTIITASLINGSSLETQINVENSDSVFQSDTVLTSLPSDNKIIKKTLIDVNTSSCEELQKLTGIGETLAKRIIAYRNNNGKFNTLEDLINVKGIGEKKLKILKEEVQIW